MMQCPSHWPEDLTWVTELPELVPLRGALRARLEQSPPGTTHEELLLAGGLDASNVAEAIALVRPWGVDACSRIESAPGKKDHKKMTEFLQAARTADRS